MNLIWLNTFHGEVSFGSNSLDFNTTGVAAVGSLKGNIDFENGLVFSSPTNTNSFYLNIDTAASTDEIDHPLSIQTDRLRPGQIDQCVPE